MQKISTKVLTAMSSRDENVTLPFYFHSAMYCFEIKGYNFLKRERERKEERDKQRNIAKKQKRKEEGKGGTQERTSNRTQYSFSFPTRLVDKIMKPGLFPGQKRSGLS